MRDSIMEHAIELRKRLIYVVIVFGLSLAGGLFAADPVLNWVKTSIPVPQMEWNVFSPWDGIRLYMQVAMVAGAAVTLPFALYHTWAFMKPGLMPVERKAALRYIPISFMLLVVGVAFSYFIVFRMALQFSLSMNERLGLTATYGAAQYFSFLLQIVLPMSLMFELPVVVLFLSRLGLLTPQFFKRTRRYTYLLLTIVSTAITPPDFLSAVVVMVPLVVLYEISVWISQWMYRRRQLQHGASEAASTV